MIILPEFHIWGSTRLSSTPSSPIRAFSKVLMDGGSGLNILYVDKLDLIGIGQS
jgi:hypothetical protein